MIEHDQVQGKGPLPAVIWGDSVETRRAIFIPGGRSCSSAWPLCGHMRTLSGCSSSRAGTTRVGDKVALTLHDTDSWWIPQLLGDTPAGSGISQPRLHPLFFQEGAAGAYPTGAHGQPAQPLMCQELPERSRQRSRSGHPGASPSVGTRGSKSLGSRTSQTCAAPAPKPSVLPPPALAMGLPTLFSLARLSTGLG